LYRVQTEYLWNEKLSDTELAGYVELVYDNNFSGGCAMDSEGNIYLSETETHNITLWSPHGKSAVLVSDPRLVRPDGSFISPDRKLWIPVKQPVVFTSDTGKAERVFNIYSIDLPNNYEGIPLGNAVSGS